MALLNWQLAIRGSVLTALHSSAYAPRALSLSCPFERLRRRYYPARTFAVRKKWRITVFLLL